MASSADTMIVHASCVAFDDKAVLIRGASGAGKSALALQLMSFGADLVADDRTELVRHGEMLVARAPDPIFGLIEARGLGILKADARHSARLDLVVCLDTIETARMPPQRRQTLCGVDIPSVHKFEGAHFPAAILQYLKAGPQDTP